MSETVKTILEELFWIIIPLLAGYLFNYLRVKQKENNYKKLIRISSKMPEHGESWLKFITANSGQYDEEELVTYGYVFEYRAAGELGSSLIRLYSPNHKISTVMSKKEFTGYSEDELDCNLILIGGPNHNSVTREFFAYMNGSSPFRYEGEDTLVYTDPDTHEETRYCPKSVDGKCFGEDYALIMNTKNPYDPSKRVIYISGCRSIGCYGGAIYLSQQLKEIKKRVHWDEYALIVFCKGDEEDLNAYPKLKKAYRLNNIEYDLNNGTEASKQVADKELIK